MINITLANSFLLSKKGFNENFGKQKIKLLVRIETFEQEF